jgi:hypothetical protein
MKTLFNVKFNWGFYILALILIRSVWLDMSWVSFIAIAITLHQFLLLFFSVGSVIPIRYLAGTFMCVQMLLGPAIAYNGANVFQRFEYQMKIPEMEYFIYAIPAVSLFIVGLHITAGKLKGEVLDRLEIARFIDRSGNLPYILIGVGFLASYIPGGGGGGGLAFIFYLISGFKFIGLFMLLLGTRQLKTWVMALVFGSILISTLRGAMFHDFLTWLIMLGAVLGIKYKPSLIFKTIGAISFILLAVIIQQVKGDYREAAYTGTDGGAGLETFQKLVEEKKSSNSLFSSASLAKSNIRINQGYIITSIMITVPDKVPFEYGKELMRILEAAFLPRIIAPNKLEAGDRTIFTKYSGLYLRKGTSMGLSSMGDAYINFGIFGGCIFMFFLGLTFSTVLNGFYKFSKYYPFLLLFTPLVFYYPIRPDCELQTSLGHLVKSCMLIYLLILFWKKDLSKIMVKKKEPVNAKPVIANAG